MKPRARLLSGNHKTETMQNFFNAKAQSGKDAKVKPAANPPRALFTKR